MLKIVIYVPEDALDAVKDAIFAAGAGQFDGYDRCCWQTKGTGQFRPLPGSSPNRGDVNAVRSEPEYRLEVICQDSLVQGVVKAIQRSHPYEVPAFDVIKLEDVGFY